MEGPGSHSSVKACKGKLAVFFLPPPFNKTVSEHLSNALPEPEVHFVATVDGMPTMGQASMWRSCYNSCICLFVQNC